MRDKAKILDKVKKMLAQADGTTFEEESATALAMAREMLAKHNLTMSDLRDLDSGDNETVDEKVCAGTVGGWQLSLSRVIAKWTTCEVIFSAQPGRNRRLAFIGITTEVEIASYTYELVILQVDKMLRKKRKELRRARRDSGLELDRNAASHYTQGYALGIVDYLEEKLKERVKEETSRALVVVQDPRVGEWMRENTGKGRGMRTRSSSDEGRSAGYRDGHKVQINPGVKGGKGQDKISE